MALYGALLLLLYQLAHALPKPAFPLNSQVPPVARVEEPFKFQFSPQTFTSTDAIARYSLDNAPAWLHLDSPSRTLSGTPTANDTGPSTFKLGAVDGQGASEMQVTLLVVQQAPPTSSVNVTDVLAKVGRLADESTLAVYPRASLYIAFGSDAFDTASRNLTYYATSSDRSPLPSWLAFDSANASFVGQTPYPATSPRRFGVSLFATAIPGFAEASLSFIIDIANNQLAFDPVQRIVQVAPGSNFSLDVAQDLLLDGSTIDLALVAAAQVNGLDWLRVDPRTLRISGTAPLSFTAGNATLAIQDVYNNSATMTLHLRASAAIFARDLGVVNVTTGVFSSQRLPSDLFLLPDVKVDVSFGDASNWLHYNPLNQSIEGLVPKSQPPGPITANLTASSAFLYDTETQSFTIQVQEGSATATTQTITGGGSMTVQSTVTGTSTDGPGGVRNDTGSSGLNPGEIAVVVLIPVVAVATLVVILCLFCHRRSKRRQNIQRALAYQEKGVSGLPDVPAPPKSTPMETVPEIQPRTHHTASSSWQTEEVLVESRGGSSSSNGLFEVGLPGSSLGMEDLTQSRPSSLALAQTGLSLSQAAGDESQQLRTQRPQRRAAAGGSPYVQAQWSRGRPDLIRWSYQTGSEGAGAFLEQRRVVPGLGHGRASDTTDSVESADTETTFSYAGTSVLSGFESDAGVSRESSLLSNRRRSAQIRLHRRATLRVVNGSGSFSKTQHTSTSSQQASSRRQSYNPFFASAARESKWGSQNLKASLSRSRSSKDSTISTRSSSVYQARKARGASWQEGFPRVVGRSSHVSSRGSLFTDAERDSVITVSQEQQTLTGTAEKVHGSVSVAADAMQQHPLKMHRRGSSRGDEGAVFL